MFLDKHHLLLSKISKMGIYSHDSLLMFYEAGDGANKVLETQCRSIIFEEGLLNGYAGYCLGNVMQRAINLKKLEMEKLI